LHNRKIVTKVSIVWKNITTIKIIALEEIKKPMRAIAIYQFASKI
jgi:hypothetical protein